MGVTLHGFISASLTFDIHLSLIFLRAVFHSFRQTVNNSSPAAVDFHNGPVFFSPLVLSLYLRPSTVLSLFYL